MKTIRQQLASLLTIAACIFALGFTTSANASRLIIISGLGGEEYYSDLFDRWSTTLVDVATTSLGLGMEQIYAVAENPERNPDLISAKSTRENIKLLFEQVASDAGPDESIMVVMLGHGTASATRVLFNVPGRDFDGADLNEMLKPLGDRQLALVNTSPASAPFMDALSAPNRIIITATASAAENQHTHFGGYFVAAFAESGADADKDKRVSLLEAFTFAKQETERFYSDENRMITEHAMIDDNADGKGSLAADLEAGDGKLAKTFSLTGSRDLDETDPKSRARLKLDIAARQLVGQIESLKRTKQTLHEEEYASALESLLLQLALNRRELRSNNQ